MGILDSSNQRVKEIRKGWKMNQKDFAEILEISRVYLASVETGKKPVTTKLANNISKNTYMSAEWILTGKGKVYDKHRAFISNGNIRDELTEALIDYLENITFDTNSKDYNSKTSSSKVIFAKTDNTAFYDFLDIQIEEKKRFITNILKGEYIGLYELLRYSYGFIIDKAIHEGNIKELNNKELYIYNVIPSNKQIQSIDSKIKYINKLDKLITHIGEEIYSISSAIWQNIRENPPQNKTLSERLDNLKQQ